MKAGKLLIGLLSGAAAGAALGVLFAPKKGVDTRKSIAQTGDNYLEDAKGSWNRFSDSISNKAKALKDRSKANLTSSKSKAKVHETKAQVHEMKAS